MTTTVIAVQFLAIAFLAWQWRVWRMAAIQRRLAIIFAVEQIRKLYPAIRDEARLCFDADHEQGERLIAINGHLLAIHRGLLWFKCDDNSDEVTDKGHE